MNIKELMQQVRVLQMKTGRNVTGVFAGNYRSSFKGRGIESEDVREYSEGDDARDIDWIVTAREGKPYVKKYREEREMNTFLLLDTSASMNFGSGDLLKKEQALLVAGTIAFSSLKNNDRLGALIYGGKETQFMPLKKGNVNTIRVLRNMIEAFDDNTKTQENLEYALGFLHKTQKKRAICFLITDHIDPSAEKMLALTAYKHDFVILHISDPLETNLPQSGLFAMSDPETGHFIEWNVSNKKLRTRLENKIEDYEKWLKYLTSKYGIDILRISTNDNITKKLFTFFKKRQHRP
jgi:uncharacterized protein (DUF58 family)